MIAKRLRPFGTTIFSEMTALALERNAVNLSQGYPDFDGPTEVLDAAADALRRGPNQYARSAGVPELAAAVAAHQRRHYGVELDPQREVTVTCGATEGIAASLLGLLDPGDEVILLEPFYDSYPACVALAGATPRFVTLRFPDFRLDPDELRAAVTPRTRALVLNTPHNPSGRVLSPAELEQVAEVCQAHDLVVVADEVYEHLTFDGVRHHPVATLAGMWDRVLTVGSLGKTYSLTGWKIGWVTGPARLVAAAQAAHQFLTFCSPPHLQLAAAHALTSLGEGYHDALRARLEQGRDLLVAALGDAGLEVSVPQGTYFVMAAFDRVFAGDDRAFVRHVVDTCGVAAIPPSVFYGSDLAEGRRLVRFAFCKRLETLAEAAERLRNLTA
jgi:N-succinyldiaminopimelate aminotransferase